MTQDEVDLERRFSGVRRLYGEAGLARLQAAHVCVIGLGGVGSWAAEALARNAVGHLTLIDLDNIAESNVNRQLHALGDAFGQAKVAAMAARIHLINPDCQVRAIEDFVTPENVAQLLENDSDAVFDAIDDARAKVALATHCRLRLVGLRDGCVRHDCRSEHIGHVGQHRLNGGKAGHDIQAAFNSGRLHS